MSDLIDRQAAIDALRKMQTYKLFSGDDMLLIDQAGAQTELMMLPPAQLGTNLAEVGTDTISRQAVKEILDKNQMPYHVYPYVWDAINALPPAQPEPSQVAKDIARIVENGQDMRVIAQPEIIRCKDCKHWIPYDWMFGEVWQSRNINDYPEDEIGCKYCDMAMKADDFCSRAEKGEVTT